MPNSGAPKTKVPPDTCEIKCTGKTDPDGKAWSACDYEQFCAKLKAAERKGGRRTRKTAKKKKKMRRKEGNDYAKTFRDNWHARPRSPQTARRYFYAECAFKETNGGQNVDDYSPDHIQEIQVGGPPTGATNIKWLKTYVNESVGPHLKKFKPPKHKKIQADCCPA